MPATNRKRLIRRDALTFTCPACGAKPRERYVSLAGQVIRSSPDLWMSTLLLVVYDEHGGFYDHVEPPAAVPPDAHHEEWTLIGLEYGPGSLDQSVGRCASREDTIRSHQFAQVSDREMEARRPRSNEQPLQTALASASTRIKRARTHCRSFEYRIRR
jgi:Phosphoesterase family